MLAWRPKDRWQKSHGLMALSSASSTGRSAEVSLDGALKGCEKIFSKLVLHFGGLKRYISSDQVSGTSRHEKSR